METKDSIQTNGNTSCTIYPSVMPGTEHEACWTLYIERSPWLEACGLFMEWLQQDLEQCWGVDLLKTRLHVAWEAAWMHAPAITCGEDVFFSPRHRDLGVPENQKLLAHELAHVLQYRAGRLPPSQVGGLTIIDDLELEMEAEQLARSWWYRRSRVLRNWSTPCRLQAPSEPSCHSLLTDIVRHSAAPPPVQRFWYREAPWEGGPHRKKYQWIILPHNRNDLTKGRGAPAGWYLAYRYETTEARRSYCFRRLDEDGRELPTLLYEYSPEGDHLSLKKWGSPRASLKEASDFNFEKLRSSSSTSNPTVHGMLSASGYAVRYDSKKSNAVLVYPPDLQGETVTQSPEMKNSLPEFFTYNSQKLYPHEYPMGARYIIYASNEFKRASLTEKYKKKATATIFPIHSTEKIRTDTLTAAQIHLWSQAPRSVDQGTLMGASAKEEAKAAGIARTNSREWHWCHLIAHSMGSHEAPQEPGNLVAGTKEANAEMIHLESVIKAYISATGRSLDLHVRAILVPGTHFATKLTYTVESKFTYTRFVREYDMLSQTRTHMIATPTLATEFFDALAPVSDKFEPRLAWNRFEEAVNALRRGEMLPPSPVRKPHTPPTPLSSSPMGLLERLFLLGSPSPSPSRGGVSLGQGKALPLTPAPTPPTSPAPSYPLTPSPPRPPVKRHTRRKLELDRLLKEANAFKMRRDRSRG